MKTSSKIKFRFRTNWRGKLILQVGLYYINTFGVESSYWRDAKTEDLPVSLLEDQYT